jgi:hypothetical protein
MLLIFLNSLNFQFIPSWWKAIQAMRYRGSMMCWLLQRGQRPGLLNRFRFLKAKPHEMHFDGMIIRRLFKDVTERAMWGR